MVFPYEERIWLKHYPPGVSFDMEFPIKSVGEAFDEAVERWQNKTAIIFYGSKISFKELKEKVDRLANALYNLGIRKGERLAFLLLNSPEFVISFYAAVKIGAVITAISPVYVSREVKYQLENSGAEHLICQDILYENIEETGYKFKNIILTNISESLPRLMKMMSKSILRGVYQKMASPSPEIFKRENVYQLQELIRKYPPNPPKVQINPKEDILLLPYTGGTTGPPKGAMITHYNVIANSMQFFPLMYQLEEGEETLIAFFPYYHAAGLVALVFSLLKGFTQVIITTPETDDILSSIVKYNATYFIGAPTIFEILKDYEKRDRVNWKQFKVMHSGADALHEITAKDWEARTGVKLIEGYGMTETTALATLSPPGKQKFGSIGFPVPGTMVAIVDPDEDKFLPVGEIGEIAIIGPQITKGYWMNPEANKACEATIDGKRWWRTGDLGNMDDEGYFHIYDRKRDLIKYKGLRVFAREVEEVLKEHPKIKEVGVIGAPDLKVGENVKAVIVLESDARGKISEADIIEYCKDKLAHYKIPKIVEFVGEIPKTDVGKVSRREIREEGET